MNLFVKSTNALLSAILILAAWVQLNDPDPLFWIALYLLAAMIPAARVIERPMPNAIRIAAGVLLAGLLISLPGFGDYLASQDYASIDDKMTGAKPYIEYAREFLGTAIALSCLLVNWNWHTRSTTV